MIGVDLNEVFPDPNVFANIEIFDPANAWPDATGSIMLAASTEDGVVMIQTGYNNGVPGERWTRSRDREGDWSDWIRVQLPEPITTALKEREP